MDGQCYRLLLSGPRRLLWVTPVGHTDVTVLPKEAPHQNLIDLRGQTDWARSEILSCPRRVESS